MTDTTHDPPVPEAADQAPAQVTHPHSFAVDLPRDRLALLSGAGFEKYVLMRDRMGGNEPLATVVVMKRGGYRFKSKRGMPGVLVYDRDHKPVPDLMSFRQIAPILTEMSGVPVTYETVRRWYDIVFPGEAGTDEPDAEAEPDLTPVPVQRTVRRRTPAKPAVGDEHAETIREAVAKASASTTNPAVPPAAFHPPTE